MEASRLSKKELLQRFEKRSAKERQSLHVKQQALEEKERRVQEERRQLEQEWQRFNENYKTGKKFINELWDESDETDDEKPAPHIEAAHSAPIPQHERLSSSDGSSGRSVSEKVLAIVDDWQDDSIITQSEVTPKYLRKYHAHRTDSLVSAISHALSQLAKGEDRVLELVEKGAGSRPSKYRKRTVNVGP